MNGDLQLRVQAWLDNELSGEQAREVERLVASDADAAALAAELRLTRGFLLGNEAVRETPASRDFYWSGIRRGIERGEVAGLRHSNGASWWAALRRFMVPASGMALVMLLAALSVRFFGPASLEDAALQMVEVENLSEEMGSISYRSQSDNMFVVYLYSKEQAPVEEDADTEPLEDLLFQ